ncbi:MAG TPA: right-handed parallel beta-helix repeat-containing protein [Burkholderiales bacterium]
MPKPRPFLRSMRSACYFVLYAMLTACVGIADGVAASRILKVGPDQAFHRPSDAAGIARDGDVVEIAAGDYPGDVAVWRQNRLTLRGVGRGRAHLRAAGRSAEGKAIWVIKGRQTTVERIEFSGAAVPDGNGAGIRAEGEGLVIRDCYFHDNENGILGGAGDVLIEGTEFARNGAGDGRTHNLYIDRRVTRFTLRNSYSHHAKVGHNVKSRARENRIEYNRIMDESDGNASYAIDLPDGGIAYVIGNLIQQGPSTENATIVSYGAEGLLHPRNETYLVNNTTVNDAGNGTFLRIAPGTERAVAINNLFVGAGGIQGEYAGRNNLFLTDPKLMDRERFDYRLAAGSPAIDAGVDPGDPLRPVSQYVHPRRAATRPVLGPPDVGAYEFHR